MNWLSNFARPGLSNKKKPEDARDTPDNLWIKDPLSGESDLSRRTGSKPIG